MRDPVALAYSGRVVEAYEAAVEQSASEDAFVVAQALEAFAVLGEQYLMRTTPVVDERLLQSVSAGDEALSRRSFDAASALGSAALENVAVRRLEAGEASWDVLRYAAQCPTLKIGRALASGWEKIPPRLRDEALLTSRVMPVSNADENDAWAERVLASVDDASEDVRAAAFEAIKVWRPNSGAQACARALEDEAEAVRSAAGSALAELDVDLLVVRAAELEESFPDVADAVPANAKDKLEQARKART